MNIYLKNAIDQASILLNHDLQEVKDLILKKVASETTLIPDITQHIISSGGKRIRPIMLLLSSKMFGYKGEDDLLLAACVEFIHTATLLHDDVIDDNTSRRGVTVPNKIWGNKPAILVGDYLFTKSFELMVETKSLEILKLLSTTSSTLVQGELMQLSSINNINMTIEDYMKVIEAKTSSLFTSSVLSGAILAQTSEENKHNITQYAKLLGNSFQMLDDLIDYLETKEESGKNIGTDLYEQKVTIPIIVLAQLCNYSEKAFLTKIFNDGTMEEDYLQQVIQLLQKYNCAQHVKNIVEKNNIQALEYLNNIPFSNTYKDHLASMVKSF